MLRKKKPDVPPETQTSAGPKISKELLDQRSWIRSPKANSTIFRALKKAVIERAMGAEMSEHLGYRHGEPKPGGQTKQHNGTSGKTVLTDHGAVDIEVPRDREGSYEPLIVGKHERHFAGFIGRSSRCMPAA